MDIEKCMKDKEFFWNHPEEEFQEFETSAYIERRLKEIGYVDIKTNIAKTGIVAEINGAKSGKCILFRADMDAVVMDESHRTKHTCGHDAHMAILLSLAEFLINNKEKINGHVKLLFQPAEEGRGGAKPMIDAGVLKNPDVDKVFAIHVWSEVDEGKVAIKEGAVMASTNPFNIVITGKGGHVAIPEKCINPIYVAQKIISAIQAIGEENYNENEKTVVGITAVNGGSTNNVIPDVVTIKGTIRTYDNNLASSIWERINKHCKETAKETNTEIKLENVLMFPAVINSKEEAEEVTEIVKNTVGENMVITDYKSMCAEDFAFFLQEKSGAFIFIGNKGENIAPQHNEDYFVSKTSIEVGIKVMREIAKKYLNF